MAGDDDDAEDNMNETPRVAVLGAGAMGSLFGGLLAEGGLDVTLVDVWQDHVDAINRDGLKMVGFGGDRAISVAATAAPGRLAPADVVFVQCKAMMTEAALAGAANLVGPDTVVVSFQNGLGNEEVIAGVIGEDRVLGGLTSQGASLEGPGIVRNYAELPTTIGEMAGGPSERATRLAAVLSAHGLPTVASENVRLAIWKKLMANVGVSPTSGITNLPVDKVMAVPELRETIFAALDEAAAVARAEGIDLDAEETREVLLKVTGAGGTGGNKSSLCHDLLNQRPTEIDFINGAIVRLGAQHGVATPVNSTLVAAVKAMESAYLG